MAEFTPKQLRNIGEAALVGDTAPADISTDPAYQADVDAAIAALGEHREAAAQHDRPRHPTTGQFVPPGGTA